MRIATLCLAGLASACAVTAPQPYETAYSTAAPAPVYPTYPSYSTPAATPNYPVRTTANYPVTRTELSYDELNQCIALDRSAKMGAHEVVASNPSLESRRQRIMADNRRIEAQRRAIDTRSRTQVETFNRDVADLAAFTVDYNQDTNRMQARADEVNRLVAQYNQQCASRPYKRKDMRALTGSPDYKLGGPRSS